MAAGTNLERPRVKTLPSASQIERQCSSAGVWVLRHGALLPDFERHPSFQNFLEDAA